MCFNDRLTESLLGTSSLAVTIGHAILGQIPNVPLDGLLSIITQVGGPGLAVWLVYYHTTVTIPNAQREFRQERAELVAAHAAQLIDRREAFQSQIQNMLNEHREEMHSIVEKSFCRYRSE